jgi:cation/acetate symporter
VLFGLVSAIGLIIISPIVWGGPPGAPDTGAFTWYDLNNPGLISIPMGFLGCWLGTVLSKERGAERTYHELHVRSETGLGAERELIEH